MPGNLAVWELWRHVRTQWRAGALGVIGLDYGECRRMARDLGLVWSYGLLRKLQALERFELERWCHDAGKGDPSRGR